MKVSKKLLPVVALGALMTQAAHAAPVDVSGVVTNIGEQIGPVTAIGGGILLVIVAVAAFRWIRSALR